MPITQEDAPKERHDVKPATIGCPSFKTIRDAKKGTVTATVNVPFQDSDGKGNRSNQIWTCTPMQKVGYVPLGNHRAWSAAPNTYPNSSSILARADPQRYFQASQGTGTCPERTG